jgi:Fe-S-cluster containining protein
VLACGNHVTEYVPLDHPRFRRVDPEIFSRRIVADCMAHRCRMHEDDREHLDACCQHGADVDTGERDRILAHAAQIRGILRPEARNMPWFEGDESRDPDFPSGRVVRTHLFRGGCVFLAHDQRGCAIHRASIEGGWDFDGVKPHVCRLFPLSYDTESILISDDYLDYSCAHLPAAPTLYRNGRSTLDAIFGADLVRALDVAEAVVHGDLTPPPRAIHLPIV